MAQVTSARQYTNQSDSNRIAWHSTLVHPNNRPKLQQFIYQKPQQSIPRLHFILLDSSASILSQNSLSHAKGILQYLCQQLHQRSELLSIISFGNQCVETLLPVQIAPKSIDTLLNNIQGGGGTPLNQALHLIAQRSKYYADYEQALYILTDARSHQPLELPELNLSISVIDMENQAVRLGKAQELAKRLKGQYISLQQMQILSNI